MVVKKIINLFLIVLLFLLMIGGIVLSLIEYHLEINEILYFVIFIDSLSIVKSLKLSVATIMKLAFFLFVTSIAVFVFGVEPVGEELTRYSFIFWVIALLKHLLTRITIINE